MRKSEENLKAARIRRANRMSITEKMRLMASFPPNQWTKKQNAAICSAMIIGRPRKGYPAPSFSMEKVQQFRDDLASALKKQEEE